MMSDDLSSAVLESAVKGAASGLAKLVAEKAAASGSAWLSRVFGSYGPKVQRRATENVGAFLAQLAQKVSQSEREATAIDQAKIDEAYSDPQFYQALNQAFLASAHTAEPEKHQVLARLIANRLREGSEATVNFATAMACEATGNLTVCQLEILGLCDFFEEIRPKHFMTEAHFQTWLEVHLASYLNLEFGPMDLLHLDATRCVSYQFTSDNDLAIHLSIKNDLVMDKAAFAGSSCGSIIQSLWDDGICNIKLTSVGSLIGGCVADTKTMANLGGPTWASSEAKRLERWRRNQGQASRT